MSDVCGVSGPMTPGSPHPMQPFIRREDGEICFKPNRILKWYFDKGRLPLADCFLRPEFADEDLVQLVQLVGMSLSLCSKMYEDIDDASLKAAEKAAKKKRQPKRHPMQPVVVADQGVIRFKQNSAVRWLIDSNVINLNESAMLGHQAGSRVEREDHEQLAQLIGYSLSGYADLSYVTDRSYAAAARAAEKLTGKKW